MSRLKKSFVLLSVILSIVISISFTTVLGVAQAGASTTSGLGQLDQGFGSPTATSGVKSGIAQSSGLECPTQTYGVAYAKNSSGLIDAIAAVGNENYSSGGCSSDTQTTGIAALFSNSGAAIWTKKTAFNSLQGVKVIPGNSGPIIAAGDSASMPAIGVLSQADGNLLASTKVALTGYGLIPTSGSYNNVLLGPQISIKTGPSAYTAADSIYAVGKVQTSSGTELLIGEYGLENPTSSSPTIVPIDGFGNQGSGSNLYLGSIPDATSASGTNITDAALGSSGNLYITGDAQFQNSGCARHLTLGFVLNLVTPVNSSGIPGSSGTTYNKQFNSSGVFLLAPKPISSGESVACFPTKINSILIDSAVGQNQVPPQILLAGAQTTASSGIVPQSAVATLAGINTNGEYDKQFGSSGTVFSEGGAGSLNEADSIYYIPTPGRSSGEPASIIVSGIDYNNSEGASNFEVGVSHYQLNGVIDTSFGDGTLGTSLIPGCENPSAQVCGNHVIVQPDGSINTVGGIDSSYDGLAIAQLTDREVELSTSTPTISVSPSSTPRALFTLTVSAPGNSGLVGIPGGIVADFSTANGTGKPGYNYQGSSGSVVFPCQASDEHISSGSITCNNNLSATISIPTLYPVNATGSASFSLNITAVKNAGKALSTATVDMTYPPPPPVTTAPPSTAPPSTVSTTVTTIAPTTTSLLTAPVTTTTVVRSATQRYQTVIPGQGYLAVTAKGQVFPYGHARSFGSVPHLRPLGKIIAITSTPNGKGYWLLSSLGAVYAFGNAHKYGQVNRRYLRGSITGFAATSNGKGYWLLSSLGAVYAFGNAHKYGQVILKKALGTMVAIMPASNNKGYWLVSSKGRVYKFGTLRTYGSLNPKLLKGMIISAAPAISDKGYWLLSSLGVVYTFGDAHNYGYYGHQTITKAKSKKMLKKKKTFKAKNTKGKITKKYIEYFVSQAMSSNGPVKQGSHVVDQLEVINKDLYIAGVKNKKQPAKRKVTAKHPKKVKKIQSLRIVAIVATRNRKGYWLISSQGNIYNYGDAKFYGSPAAKHLKIVESLSVV